MAHPPFYPVHRWRLLIRRKLHHPRVPSVRVDLTWQFLALGGADNTDRFLVDHDMEVEGLAVIADFQGKPLDHEDVQLEYKEIRDAVLLDVSFLSASCARWES